MDIPTAQFGMLAAREAQPIMSKIGTFGKFRAGYGTLTKTRNVLGSVGYAGAMLNTYLDYKSWGDGDIGIGRFGFRTTGTFSSLGGGIAIGSAYGGPWGAVCGAIISGSFWAGEKAYDGYMWWQTQMGIFLNNCENGLKNGWVPGR